MALADSKQDMVQENMYAHKSVISNYTDQMRKTKNRKETNENNVQQNGQ